MASPTGRKVIRHTFDANNNQPSIFANASINQRRTRSSSEALDEDLGSNGKKIGKGDLNSTPLNTPLHLMMSHGSDKNINGNKNNNNNNNNVRIVNNKPRSDMIYVESKILKRWKARWVVLDESAICAFETEEHWKNRSPPVYAVFTEDITKTLVSNRDDKIVLLETKTGDSMKLKFPDRSKAFEWKVDILNRSFKKKK